MRGTYLIAALVSLLLGARAHAQGSETGPNTARTPDGSVEFPLTSRRAPVVVTVNPVSPYDTGEPSVGAVWRDTVRRSILDVTAIGTPGASFFLAAGFSHKSTLRFVGVYTLPASGHLDLTWAFTQQQRTRLTGMVLYVGSIAPPPLAPKPIRPSVGAPRHVEAEPAIRRLGSGSR